MLSVEVRVLSHQLVIRLASSLGNRLQSSVVAYKSCSECLRYRIPVVLYSNVNAVNKNNFIFIYCSRKVYIGSCSCLSVIVN